MLILNQSHPNSYKLEQTFMMNEIYVLYVKEWTAGLQAVSFRWLHMNMPEVALAIECWRPQVVDFLRVQSMG